MAKTSKHFVLLKSTESNHSYTIWKDSRAPKMELTKFDPVLRKHTTYKEKKAPNPKK